MEIARIRDRLTHWWIGQQNAQIRHGTLGKRTSSGYTFDVPGRPGWMYVTFDASDTTVSTAACINHVVRKRDRVPVRVIVNEYDQLEIIGVSGAEFLDYSGGAALYETDIAPAAQLIAALGPAAAGRVTISSGMVVAIAALHYVWRGTPGYYPGGTLDLTSYIPGTSNHHAWCAVGIDPETNTATGIAGSSQIVTAPLSESQIAAIDISTVVSVAAVRLTNGMTAISEMARIVAVRYPWADGDPALITSTENVGDPPTDAELDAAFGAPSTVGDFTRIIDDNGDDTTFWLVHSTGTSWVYVEMTKAT